jgi:proteasome lid subunit RPN8/RPN11
MQNTTTLYDLPVRKLRTILAQLRGGSIGFDPNRDSRTRTKVQLVKYIVLHGAPGEKAPSKERLAELMRDDSTPATPAARRPAVREPASLSRMVRDDSAAPYSGAFTADERETIASALAIMDAHLRDRESDALSHPRAAGDYVKLQLSGCAREVFGVLFLDTRHRAIAWRELFYGTVDGAEVHPREVVKAALELNAAAVILGHNHPSGNPEPSAADRAVTARLKQSLALVDVRLLDHFVIGEGAPVSLAARGWI